MGNQASSSKQASSKQSSAKGHKKAVSKKQKKAKRIISSGKVYIIASFNNTLVYITDLEGNVIAWATAGGMGYRGSRKSTPYAAQLAAGKAGNTAKDDYGMKTVDVYLKGPGPGREGALRMLDNIFKVTSMHDVTGIPHNGCRAEKERRV